MPQVSPATIVFLAAVAFAGAWAAGLLRPEYDAGRIFLRVWRSNRVVLSFDLRDIWLLLFFGLVMGWAVAAAVERSAWVPDSEGRLVPALALTTLLGWAFTAARFSRLAYVVASIPTILIGLALLTPSPLHRGPTLESMRKWLFELPSQTNLLLLMGLVVMFLVTGLWTSWWIFKRRNGLVALLPTGTILAVEIINDTSISLTFFTLVWLAAAASVLLRINYVSLKESWRNRRLPHAADTGWTFGEVGVEATAAILLIAFVAIPPLSSTDISSILTPGLLRADSFHLFGLGNNGSRPGSIGSIGYSEVVQPGSQLKAKSQTVMIVSGDTPIFYPYWRGIALGGWNGIAWYELPSTPEIPVRQQPLLAPGANVPRSDIPTDTQRVQTLHNTFRVVVPMETTKGAVFTAGELVSVRNQPISIRGILTSVPAPAAGPIPALVNVQGDAEIANFDTVDRVRFARQLQPPYGYSTTEAIPNVDVADLQSAGTDYPAWLAPYMTLYDRDQIAVGYSTSRDQDITALAQSIVKAAGAVTPYDQAKAIESWFIEKGRFTYTLTPPRAPAGVRPLDYFLFNSKKGFCQDFSTAMNVMLRTLHIPSRQMSGFGLGSFDEKTHLYSVNSLDAHSWVEVYFPGYGWVPFEPTPDGINSPINRPATRDELNAPLVGPSAAATGERPGLRDPVTDTGVGASARPFSDIWRPLVTAAGVLLLLALIAFLLAARWLMGAKDLPRIWRRLLFLGDRLQVKRWSGDTPQEFGDRLADSVPELDTEVRRLATLYTRASFRRGGLTAAELAEARRAWGRVRSSYAGLVARAWRDALREGRVVSAAADAASKNREPSRPR